MTVFEINHLMFLHILCSLQIKDDFGDYGHTRFQTKNPKHQKRVDFCMWSIYHYLFLMKFYLIWAFLMKKCTIIGPPVCTFTGQKSFPGMILPYVFHTKQLIFSKLSWSHFLPDFIEFLSFKSRINAWDICERISNTVWCGVPNWIPGYRNMIFSLHCWIQPILKGRGMRLLRGTNLMYNSPLGPYVKSVSCM